MHQALPRERRAQERRGGTHNRLHTTTGAAAANEGPRSRERHAPRGRHTQACMLCRTSQVQPNRAAADAPPLQLHMAAAGQGTKGGTQSEGCGRQAQVLPVSTTCQATKQGVRPKGGMACREAPPLPRRKQAELSAVGLQTSTIYPPSAHKNMQGRISSTVSGPGTTRGDAHTPDQAANKGQAQPACDSDRGYTWGRHATDRGWPRAAALVVVAAGRGM